MSEVLSVQGGVVIPRGELLWRFSRSSGPGGQSVNTADSRVELRWDVSATSALSESQRQRVAERLASRMVDGVLVITASQHRAQWHNRRAAEAKLVALLVEALAPPAAERRPTRPSKGRVRARLEAKRRRSLTKQGRRSVDDAG